MSSAASGLMFMPNLMIPRAPKPGAQMPDLIQFAQGIAAALEHFRVILESQTESFIASSAYIGDLVVANGHIQDLAVTTAKVNNAAITTAKINDLAVTTAKVDNAAITSAKINDLAVITAKIDNAAITTAKINNLAVVTAKIDDLTVTTIKRQVTNVVTGSYTASANSDSFQSVIFPGPIDNSTQYFRCTPLEMRQGWAGASTSQTQVGLLQEGGTPGDFYVAIHNGVNTSALFEWTFEWW